MPVPASLAYWVHDLDPVIFQVGPLALRWYGLAYVAGFLTAAFLLHAYYRKGWSPVPPKQLENLFIALVLGVIVGGRLGFMLLYDFGAFIRDPLLFFRVWEGGMASHGGFIGVVVAVAWFAHKHKISPLELGDLIATVTAPGLFFGRLANFINGELWGRITDRPWGVIFPEATVDPSSFAVYSDALSRLANPRHPSQLYQAALEGLILFGFIQWRFFLKRKHGWPHGRLIGEFFLGYAVLRAIGEVFREPDAALMLGLSRGTFYSIFLGLAGAAFIVGTQLQARTRSRR